MTTLKDEELLREVEALRGRLARLERTQARRARAWAVALLALLVLGTLAAQASPTCANGLPFCFQADEGAQAAEVNANFAQLKTWLEAKVGATGSVAMPNPDITTRSLNALTFSPSYSAWATYPTGAGGAAIVNDQGSYNALMVVGNSAAGGARIVKVFDDLVVGGRVVSSGYQVSCAAGESGYHYGFCCRMNIRDGSTQCRNGTDAAFTGWQQNTAPFAAGSQGPYSLDCAGHRGAANWPICCRSDSNGSTACVVSTVGGPLSWSAAASPW